MRFVARWKSFVSHRAAQLGAEQIAATLFGWTCIGSIFLASPAPIFAHGIVLGAGGTLTLGIAWIQWWRALAGHERGARDAIPALPAQAA